MSLMRTLGLLVPLLVALVGAASSTPAQEFQLPVDSQPGGFVVEGFGPDGFGAPVDAKGDLELSGSLQLLPDGRQGVLQIRARITDGWHIYSLSQQGGPGPSKITVPASDKIEILGPFRPDQEPKVREVDQFDVPLEEHYGQITWTAPIRISEGVDPQDLEVQALMDAILCHDDIGCRPIMDRPVDVRFVGVLEDSDALAAIIPRFGEFRADRSHVTILGYVQPAVVQPGGSLTLVLTSVCDDNWRIYAYAAKDPSEVAKPTLVVLSEPSEWTLGPARASEEPIVKREEDQAPVAYHGGTVTWTFEIEIPEDAALGTIPLTGLIGYQTCTEISCDRPLAAEFRVDVMIGQPSVEGSLPLEFSAAGYNTVARAAEARQEAIEVVERTDAVEASPIDLRQIDFWAFTFDRLGFRQTDGAWAHNRLPNITLNAYVLTALALGLSLLVSFLGGLILNIMPCVLPVIGLKLMAFVQQAGEDRWRVFSLNVWYSLGMWLVFLIFATVAAVLHLLGQTFAWGEHLGDPAFAIPLLLLVFTLGLSMFGVWEIPIPGFVGGGKANELAMQEGPAGAFFKGVLTTILATPCSGPFIGVAVGIAVIAPIWLNFSMFTAMALGMAFPYLVIGAFPQLIRWLPKPGEWMNTMKEFMGFILMGTGVWILYFMENRFMIPVLVMLVGVGATCWVIGGTSITATRMKRVRNWGWGALFSLVGFWLFLAFLPPPSDLIAERRVVAEDSPELPWEAYTPDRLQQYRQEGRTVLVDFTADWCLTCKTNEAVALNTFATKRRVLENGVVTLKADKTHRRTSQEVNQLLLELGNYGQTVPFLAIYPADSDEPILLDGLVTRDQVLSALERAGPSRGVADDSEA